MFASKTTPMVSAFWVTAVVWDALSGAAVAAVGVGDALVRGYRRSRVA
jgi:hypothetical protein